MIQGNRPDMLMDIIILGLESEVKQFKSVCIFSIK